MSVSYHRALFLVGPLLDVILEGLQCALEISSGCSVRATRNDADGCHFFQVLG